MIDYLVYDCILVKYICSVKLGYTYFQRYEFTCKCNLQKRHYAEFLMMPSSYFPRKAN